MMDNETPLPAADAPQADTTSVGALALTEEEVNDWKSRIKKAEETRKDHEKWWKAVAKKYAPEVTEDPEAYSLDIRTNRLFAIVERKKPDLFYQRADVTMKPSPLLDQIPTGVDMASAHASLVNERLGLDGVKARRLMNRAIFDMLMFSGVGWLFIDYHAYTKTIKVTQPVAGPDGMPQMQPGLDPQTGFPAMLPMMEEVDQVVPVKTECTAENLSPTQMLIPHTWKSTEFDKCPWLGRKFTMPLTRAKRVYADKIPDDFKPSEAPADRCYTTVSGENIERSKDEVTGIYISMLSSVFREDIIHPDHLTELVFIDGIPEPVLYRDSPHQTFDEQGRITPDSLVGHPFCHIDVRVMTDSAYLVSDAAIVLPQINELDKYRSQLIRQRDINLLKWVVSDAVPEKVLDDITTTGMGGMARVPDDIVAMFDQKFRQFPHGTFPPENFAGASQLDNDISRTVSIDSNAQGVINQGGTTATEANLVQGNRNVSIGAEQNAVAECYIMFVTKFSTLLQRHLTVEQAASVIGMEKAQAWKQWAQTLPTRLSFEILPDSQLRNDTPLDRKQDQDLYTYLANDPRVNKGPLLEGLLLKYHKDVRKIVIHDDKLPPQQPESGKFDPKMDDFDPTKPQSPIVMDLWNKKYPGLQIDPQAVQNALQLGILAMQKQAQELQMKHAPNDPQHGGKVAPMESLDRHQNAMTGGQEGTGALMPNLGGNAGGVA